MEVSVVSRPGRVTPRRRSPRYPLAGWALMSVWTRCRRKNRCCCRESNNGRKMWV